MLGFKLVRMDRELLQGIVLVLLSLCLISCTTEDVRIQKLSGNIFGTTYNIKYLAHPHSPPLAEIEQRILTRLGQIDAVMSTWNSESEISNLNQQPVGVPMEISAELRQMLALSRQITEDSHGAFDISVGPLVRLWGFDDNYVPENIPTADEIAAVSAIVGLDYLKLEGQTVIKLRPLYLTLDAIAKGYAVDEAGRVLEASGIDNYLVEIGGEIFAKGSRGGRQKQKGWRIAIEQPDELLRKSFDLFTLSNQAMATSGDYRNYYEKDGIRYSHIIDPRTARPVSHRLASVSVVHQSATIADAWATALFVLGLEEGLTLADATNIAAYFIQRNDDGFSAVSSQKFMDLLPASGHLSREAY